ncbi:MAG: hypothetical protein IT385_00170 [Deltaproteobacteria bacterium]|nr:hypothetical protein [Deltaproteobacteria bacterium]
MRWRFAFLIVCVVIAGCDDEPGPCGDGALRERGLGDLTERWCTNAAGQAHGLYQQRDASGAVVLEGGFREDLADGPWTWRDASGQIVKQADYHRALPHGTWSESDAAGLVYEHHFSYGRPCGAWEDREPTSGETVTTDYGPCDATPLPDTPTAGQRAPILRPSWDRATCPAGTTLAPDDALDPQRAACAKGGVLHGPWSRTDGESVVVEGAHADGLLSGVLARWHAGGDAPALAEHGAFDAGRPHGDWLTWRPDGTPIAVVRWVEGLRDGVETAWHDHGTRAYEGGWRGDRRDGAWTTWDATGIQRTRETWSAGVLDGPMVRHFPDGHPEVEGAFVDGLRDGVWTWSWPWGGARDERTFVAGVEDGRCRTWTALGQPDSDGERVDGRAQGTWTFWAYLPDAVVRERGVIEDGRRQGLWRGVYEPGEAPFSETSFVDDRREGAYVVWHPDGQDAIRGGFRRDEPHGPWRVWAEDGQLLVEAGYLDGDPDGLWRYWWPSGQPRAEITWDEGNPSTPRCWDEGGAEVTCDAYTLERLYLGSLE